MSEAPPTRRSDLVLGVSVFGGLAVTLIALLFLRELDLAESTAHQGDIGIAGFEWRASHVDKLFGMLVGVTALGLALHAVLRHLGLAGATWLRRTQCIVLVVLVLASGLDWLYLSRGVAYRTYAKVYDQFHYLLGPKYYEELGYFDLYDCALVADAETVRYVRSGKIRDLRTLDQVKVEKARKRAKCRDHFSDARWSEFKSDYELMARSAGSGQMQRMLGDHGYNGTPVHAMVSGFFANAFQLDYASMTLATLPDTLGMCALMAAVVWAFGWNLGALFAIFFFTSFVDRGFYICGSFLRYHWMIVTGFGLVALARRRYALSGGLIGLAAVLNVFPVLFLGGLGLKGLVELVRTRSLRREYRRFAVAAALVASLLCAGSVARWGGFSQWKDFFADMSEHSGLVTSSRIGLRYVMLYRGEDPSAAYSRSDKLAALREVRPYLRVVMVLMLLGIGLLATRLDDVEATVLVGFGVFFCAFGTVEYYYGIYAFWLLLWSQRLRASGAVWQLFLPFATMALVYVGWELTYSTAFCNNTLMSVSIFACMLASVAYLALQTAPESETLERWAGKRTILGSLAAAALLAVVVEVVSLVG